MQTGWVKLPRDFLDFEYYKDAQTKGIYIHLLLTAEYSPRRLHGVELAAGEALTTVKELAAKTGASKSQTRTALTRLQRANKIAIRTTNKFTVITLINAGFQDDNEPEISKQNGKEFEKESANKSQTKLTEFSKPSLLYKKEEEELKKEEIHTCATFADDLIDGVPVELLESDFDDEEARRRNDICRNMMDYVKSDEIVTMLQFVDGVKTDLKLTDPAEFLELCKITDKYGFQSVKEAIQTALAHKPDHSVEYIRRICEAA